MPRLFLAATAASGLAFFTACSPPDLTHLENEVNDLKVEVNRQRKEIQDLNKKLDQEEKLATAERAKDTQLRADLYEFMRQQRESTQILVNRQDGNRSATQTQRPTARPGQDVAMPTELPPDQQQMALANKDYNAGNNQGAVEAADNLIKYFPDSDYVPEALYLKGRALMAMKSYREAQESFQKIITNYPRYGQYRAALLNIGTCQVYQGNSLAAIATLEGIVKRYPSSEEARRATEILQDVKTGK
ncbi:MAG: tetratricopeptide repeat protein [Holophagales bacterium]|jgi:TolA-binding protein|nr:tetratricopeptide repeat protein [Holophagales bacterium]